MRSLINVHPNQPHHPPACPQCHAPTEPTRPFCVRCRFDLRYGTPKPLKSGQCIYCEKRCKFSDEHVFPDWLSGCFPRRHTVTDHHLRRPETHSFEESPIHTETFRRSGDPYTTVVRNVCESCNNVWMSELQNEAKPLVLSLAKGEQTHLDDAERLTLARWSAMTSINLECYGRILRTPQFQRTALMEGQMPPGWRVSIARMINTTWAGRSFNRSLSVPIVIGPEGDFLEITSTYFVIERVALHTLRAVGDKTLKLGLFGIGLMGFQFPTIDIWPTYQYGLQNNPTDLVGSDLDDIQRHFGD